MHWSYSLYGEGNLVSILIYMVKAAYYLDWNRQKTWTKDNNLSKLVSKSIALLPITFFMLIKKFHWQQTLWVVRTLSDYKSFTNIAICYQKSQVLQMIGVFLVRIYLTKFFCDWEVLKKSNLTNMKNLVNVQQIEKRESICNYSWRY